MDRINICGSSEHLQLSAVCCQCKAQRRIRRVDGELRQEGEAGEDVVGDVGYIVAVKHVEFIQVVKTPEWNRDAVVLVAAAAAVVVVFVAVLMVQDL